jgi:DNA mismatch repair protein MutS2
MSLLEEIPSLAEPLSLVGRVIDDSGELRDTPELRDIRASIEGLRGGIDEALRRCIAEARREDALQSALPVLKGNRQVVAVKAARKGRVKGIVHEVSQTGQTVFIEPAEVVEKSNALVEEEFRLEREIRRILLDLAASLAPFANGMEAARDALSRLDCALAGARWAEKTGGSFALDLAPDSAPEDSPGPSIFMAKHPLLGTRAVPIGLAFGPRRRAIVITGANTGGKTAAVKTFALCALLNQCGFPVPARSLSEAEATRLPVFSGIFADIGDDQSLDSSLSTFSAHMTRLRDILAHTEADSLVVLDELGSGTDPAEGSALALAVLDALIQKRAFVLVTGHHGALKNYAFTHGECMNASVEFDSQSLTPTYRVIPGIPGQSSALAIARKSGLGEDIVGRAETYLAGGHTDVSSLIRSLTQKYEEAGELTARLREGERGLERRSKKLLAKEIALKEKEVEILEEAKKRENRFISESRRTLENLVRVLREGEITREKTLEVKGFIAGLEEKAADDAAALDARKDEVLHLKEEAGAGPPEECSGGILREGCRVWIRDAKKEGVLVGPAARNQNRKAPGGGGDAWVVQVGSVRLTLKADNLSPLPDAPPPPPDLSLDSAGAPLPELRLLGMRAEEAVKALEKQLDLCVSTGFSRFAVIHGKGNGVLQEVVGDCLSRYPWVEEFHFARPEDGGSGKTYVALKMG